MLRLYQSNHLEILSRRLAELLAEPGQAPLQPETLVVQHPGMARWLALEIATHTGICANVRFALPAAIIWEIFQAFLPDVPTNNRFDPSLLNWRIFALLDECRDEPLFKPIHHYLQGNDEIRRFQLADRLASLFDRYLVYRPDWILRWEAGQEAIPGDTWQAELWRQLVVDSEVHWVHLQQALADFQGEHPQGLPQRLFLIGVPTLSPGYLRIIQWLSQWIDIHLFLLNPCEAHWAEIVDLKEQAKRELRADGSELYLDVGNPLLASLGRQGRDFFASINEFDPGSEEWFADPGDATLLQRLQQQILRLEAPENATTAADDSISWQICHSPMREVEVLYDQLLAMLEQTPELTPAGILVMTPDIKTYAPLIEAVFSVAADRPAIPYRISDLAIQQDSRHAAAFLELLELPGSRFSVNRMLGLLEIPAIGQRFDLDEAALEQLAAWIEQANIRWGQDGRSKTALGLPAEPRNTWRAGLERLLLGFAMPSESEQLWQGIAPLNAAEGSTAASLGGLLAFCEAVFNLEEQLSKPRGVAAWCSQLLAICEVFFLPDKTAEQPLQQIRQAIQQLREGAEAANFTREISLPLVRLRMEQAFAATTHRGFLGGGVNFCSLAPMRSLPFQVICLIGMNEGSFPREQPILSFDLMGRQFRFGDRSRRADDRYLFLETLISVRRHLYISYVGRSIKDNSSLPPAVVVDELRDYLATQIGAQGLGEIIHHHPLQPFSPDYFSRDNRLFSYSPRMREAALLVGHGGDVTRPLVTEPLPDTGEEYRQVELSQLINFYTNPARAFARQRLNLQLESGSSLLEEREPFVLAGFAMDELESELVNALLAGESGEEVYLRMSARGILPHGNPGRGLYQQLLPSASRMVDRLESLQLGDELQEIDFDQPLGEGSLDGRLRGLYHQGQLSFRVGRFYPHQMLDLWLRHLVLNWLRPEGVGLWTSWLEREGGGRFTPVQEAERYLDQLLGYYRQGMCSPLHFYPGSSWLYAERLLAKGDQEAAYNAAITKWLGSDYYPGEQAKPYHQLLQCGTEMLDSSFFATSLAVFGPLMKHLEDAG